MPVSTTVVPEDVIPCALDNWKIAITSIDQTDLGDGTKLVEAMIGIENNDSLWGKVSGPSFSDEPTQKFIFLTTEDGSTYGFVKDTQYETTGKLETPLLPPGFATLGKTIDGTPLRYSFSFLIPDSKIPEAITIDGMKVDCIQPHVVGENGQINYRKKEIQIPAKTYDLDTDITGVREAPSSRRYPNLVGAELVTPDWKETVFITAVTRNGNTIAVTFDFTNFSSHATSPSFDGYIMGNNRLFICQNNCGHEQTHRPIEPGQTAPNLTWTFTIPEDESNLAFVYIYGGKVDLNEVYRVNLED